MFRLIKSLDGRAGSNIGHVEPILRPGGSLALTLDQKAEAFSKGYAIPAVPIHG